MKTANLGLGNLQFPMHSTDTHGYIQSFFGLMDLLELRQAIQKQLDENHECRVVVLAAEGKTFSAGADFSTILSENLDMNTALTQFYNIKGTKTQKKY